MPYVFHADITAKALAMALPFPLFRSHQLFANRQFTKFRLYLCDEHLSRLLVWLFPIVQLLDPADVILARLEIRVRKLEVILGELLRRIEVRTTIVPECQTNQHLLLVAVPMRRKRVVLHDGRLVVVAIWEVLAPVPGRANNVACRIEMIKRVEVLDCVEAVECGDHRVRADFFHAVFAFALDFFCGVVVAVYGATVEAEVVISIRALMLVP
jgi:hypothetical protein